MSDIVVIVTYTLTSREYICKDFTTPLNSSFLIVICSKKINILSMNDTTTIGRNFVISLHLVIFLTAEYDLVRLRVRVRVSLSD